jgi:hypothetical protein
MNERPLLAQLCDKGDVSAHYRSIRHSGGQYPSSVYRLTCRNCKLTVALCCLR